MSGTGEPIEGRVLYPGAPIEGPRCYAHDDDGAAGHMFAGAPGRPAHTWSGASVAGVCRRCYGAMSTGDRYVCADDGVQHTTCPSRASSLAARGGAR